MDKVWKEALQEGETILWEGRAQPFRVMDAVNKPAFLRGAAKALGIFAAVTAVYVFLIGRTGAPFQPALAAVLLLIVALPSIHVFTDARLIRGLRYAATDRRLLTAGGPSPRWIDYDRIGEAAFRTDGAGVTSLLCGAYAVQARESKYREITVIGRPGDKGDEQGRVENLGFYGIDEAGRAALREILGRRCPAAQKG